MYADRKAWPLEAIQVNLTLAQEKDRSATLITKQITLEGDLTDEQRRRLMQIADKCPTHLVLTRPVTIQSELTE
jgi:putative redox protein